MYQPATQSSSTTSYEDLLNKYKTKKEIMERVSEFCNFLDQVEGTGRSEFQGKFPNSNIIYELFRKASRKG